jgi:2'-5' RNA ligase
MDESIRAFIAIEVGDEVRRSLKRLQERLRYCGATVSWVRPENIHLTLVFLGDVWPRQVGAIAESMDRIAAATPAFRFEVEGLGFFGSDRSPRVLWAGVEEPAGLLAGLHPPLLESARQVGVQVEMRAFNPHVTFGRVRSRRNVDALTAEVASAKNTRHGNVAVGRVVLIKSRLGPEGARYSIEHESPLKGAPAHGGEIDEEREHGGS